MGFFELLSKSFEAINRLVRSSERLFISFFMNVGFVLEILKGFLAQALTLTSELARDHFRCLNSLE